MVPCFWKYVISKKCRNCPPAPWGTSPVGSPRRKADGAPFRYGALWAIPTPIENHIDRDAYPVFLDFDGLFYNNEICEEERI